MGIVQFVDDDTVTARLNTLALLYNFNVGTSLNAASQMYWKIDWQWSMGVLFLRRINSNEFVLHFPFTPSHRYTHLDDVITDLQEILKTSRAGVHGAPLPPAAGPAAGDGQAAGGMQQPFMQAKTNHALLTNIICSLHSRVTRLQNQHGLEYK